MLKHYVKQLSLFKKNVYENTQAHLNHRLLKKKKKTDSLHSKAFSTEFTEALLKEPP